MVCEFTAPRDESMAEYDCFHRDYTDTIVVFSCDAGLAFSKIYITGFRAIFVTRLSISNLSFSAMPLFYTSLLSSSTYNHVD